MAPMTRNFSANGVPGEDVAAYYRRRAENGVGLIVTEGTFISHPDVASEVPAWQEDVPHLAKKVGFDGIEIMAAHGFLIDQLFLEKTNTRTDEYGGDIVKRTRFASEVIAACRRVVGPDFPISLRISQ